MASVGEITENEANEAELDLHTLRLVLDLGEIDFGGRGLYLLPNLGSEFLAETEERGGDVGLREFGGDCNFFVHCIEKLEFEFVIREKVINFAIPSVASMGHFGEEATCPRCGL